MPSSLSKIEEHIRIRCSWRQILLSHWLRNNDDELSFQRCIWITHPVPLNFNNLITIIEAILCTLRTTRVIAIAPIQSIGHGRTPMGNISTTKVCVFFKFLICSHKNIINLIIGFSPTSPIIHGRCSFMGAPFARSFSPNHIAMSLD